jgi:signal transduction histidine kinase
MKRRQRRAARLPLATRGDAGYRMQRNHNEQSNSYLAYVVVTLLMVGVLLAWQAWSRTDDFDRYHRQLGITSVRGAADEIGILFAGLHRSMHLFTSDRQPLLDRILANPDDDALWSELEAAVHLHFPEVFGMTLTDATGKVLRPDFDNHVDEICRQDIQTFIERDFRQQGVVHPNPEGYHFDIMVPWGGSDTPRGVFFLSFRPTLIAHILQRLQSPGHELLLLNRNRPGLVEITAGGSRDKLERDFHLDAGERERLGATLPIEASRWDLVDLPATRLARQEQLRNWSYAAVVFTVFAGMTLLMWYQLRRKERFRAQAEARALRHQNALAHVDRLNILGEMASGLAHELNQPLSAISTYCQSGLRILETVPDPPDMLTHVLEASSRQAKRAGNIIHRMREFAAKGKVQPAAVDINRLIADATDFFRPELNRQGITLQLDLAAGLPPVMADSIQIEQVLLNLFNNAGEAMAGVDPGSRRLAIASRLLEDGQIEIRVSDNGHGLRAETRDRIFDIFFSTREGGMGLGLSISRSIVEAHGGRLWTDTQQERGATFRFTLPVSRSE